MFYSNVLFYVLAFAYLYLVFAFAANAYSSEVIQRKESAIMTQNCFVVICLVILISSFFIFGWMAGLTMLILGIVVGYIAAFLAQRDIKSKILEHQTSKNEEAAIRDAAKIAIEEQKISPSMLQRELNIGYAKAVNILGELENLNIISSVEDSEIRKVLVKDLDQLEKYLNKIDEKNK